MTSSSVVILTTYNPQNFVEEQINSIYSGSSAQIRIYDDASEINSFNYLSDFCEPLNDRVEITRRTRNLGVIENFKLAIKENNGFDHIYLSDQDDIWAPEKYRLIEEAFKGIEGPLLIYHNAKMIDRNNSILYPSFWGFLNQDHYIHNLETFLFGNFVTGSSCAFNYSLIPYIIRLPQGLKSLHDAWIGLCAFVFGQVKRINEPLNLYRNHSQNVALTSMKKDNWLQRQLKTTQSLMQMNFLEIELELVDAFLTTFKNEIPGDKREILERFSHLRHKNGIQRKVVKRRVLKRNAI